MRSRLRKTYLYKIFGFLLLLSLTPALPAAAQTTTALATLVDTPFSDEDGSGTTTCGDIVNYIAGIDSATLGVDLLDVVWEAQVPPEAELFDPPVAANPNDTPVILSGANPGDRVIRIRLGRVCRSAGCTQTGASINFQLRILKPNAGSQLSVQGKVTGSNFPATVTDDLATSPKGDSTVTAYEPCPAAPPPTAPVLQATQIDDLARDLDGDGLVDAGDHIRYTASLRSIGDATGVVYRLTPDPHTRLVAGTVTSSRGLITKGNAPGDSTVEVQIGSLPSLVAVKVTYDVAVSAPIPAGVTQVAAQGLLTATNATERLTDDPATTALDDPTVTPLDFDPDLRIAKTDGGASVGPGGVVPYQLTWSNPSRSSASGVVVTETVPEDSSFDAAASDPRWSCPAKVPGTTCTLGVGDVVAGGSGSAAFAVRAAAKLPAGVTQLRNTAVVSDDGSHGPDTNPANNSASDETPLEGFVPDLKLAKTLGAGSDPVPGGLLRWRLAYSNAGSREATNVQLTETVPPHTSFIAAASDSRWSCPAKVPGTVCALPVGSLPAGSSGAAVFAVRVADPLPAGVEAIENCASLAGKPPSCATAVIDAAPDLAVTKDDGGASGSPGSRVIYHVVATNRGDQGATGVVLEETVPEHGRFDAGASSAGWSCTAPAAGSACTFAVGSLAAGATRAVNFAVTVDAVLPAGVTELANTATVGDDGKNGADPDPSNNTASDITPLVGLGPNLTLAKTLQAASEPLPGGLLLWSLTYENSGNQEATGVKLTETIPPHTRFVAAASDSRWSCPAKVPGTLCTLPVGSVPAGSSGEVVFAVRVAEPLPAGVESIENCASVAGKPPSCATAGIDAAPDLAVGKDDGGVLTEPGGEVTYLLPYANHGDQAASGVELSDELPTGTVLAPGASSPAWSCDTGPGGATVCRLVLGTLAPGETGKAQITLRVRPDFPGDLLTNRVSITDDGASGPDRNLTDNEAFDTTPVLLPAPPTEPTLEVTLDDEPFDGNGDGLGAGDAITYIVRITNVGETTAEAVTFSAEPDHHTALLPSSVTTTQGAVSEGQSPDHARVVVDLGDLASGATAEVLFGVEIAQLLPPEVREVVVQGLAVAGNAVEEPSDDPATAEDDDPTRTPLELRNLPPEAVDVPTLSEVSLALFAMLLAAGAVLFLRGGRVVVEGGRP